MIGFMRFFEKAKFVIILITFLSLLCQQDTKYNLVCAATKDNHVYSAAQAQNDPLADLDKVVSSIHFSLSFFSELPLFPNLKFALFHPQKIYAPEFQQSSGNKILIVLKKSNIWHQSSGDISHPSRF